MKLELIVKTDWKYRFKKKNKLHSSCFYGAIGSHIQIKEAITFSKTKLRNFCRCRTKFCGSDCRNPLSSFGDIWFWSLWKKMLSIVFPGTSPIQLFGPNEKWSFEFQCRPTSERLCNETSLGEFYPIVLEELWFRVRRKRLSSLHFRCTRILLQEQEIRNFFGRSRNLSIETLKEELRMIFLAKGCFVSEKRKKIRFIFSIFSHQVFDAKKKTFVFSFICGEEVNSCRLRPFSEN